MIKYQKGKEKGSMEKDREWPKIVHLDCTTW